MNFVAGQRYPMSRRDAFSILKHLPVAAGEPDLSRGRVFDAEPCDWHFWMKSGKRVSFSFKPGQHFVGSESNEPDPELPMPLEVV